MYSRHLFTIRIMPQKVACEDRSIFLWNSVPSQMDTLWSFWSHVADPAWQFSSTGELEGVAEGAKRLSRMQLNRIFPSTRTSYLFSEAELLYVIWKFQRYIITI